MTVEYLEAGSSDCPLIRLYEFTTVQVKHLQEVFESLANETVFEMCLSGSPEIEVVGACKLIFKLGQTDAGIVQISSGVFECVLTREGWEDVARKTDPIVLSSAMKEERVHQWLDKTSGISLLLSKTGHW